MTYSLQLYSLRRQLDEDFDGTLARVAEIGFTRVEPYNFVATTDALAPALSKYGLSAPSAHVHLLRMDAHEVFAAANTLGITTVIDPHIPKELWATAADVEASAEKLNAAAGIAADYGITVGYHNHWWEFEHEVEGTTALEYLASKLDPAVVLEVDTYWASVGGVDPVGLLERLGDRVKLIHIKDGPVTRDVLEQVPAGQGSVPIWNVIGAGSSVEIGVVEFDDYAGDIFAGITDSLTYLTAGDPTMGERA